MILFKYYVGVECKGMLAFCEEDGETVALGGVEPGKYPGDRALPHTVVCSGDHLNPETFTGWAYPEDYFNRRDQLELVPSGTIEEVQYLLVG